MRILWVSNAPWAGSGYGEQTNLFTQRFAAAGHDVAIVANHGLQERSTNWHGIPVFPQSGEDSIQTFAKHWQSDANILLYDTWCMNPDAWPEVHMAMWAPIDHVPPPPAVVQVLSHERVQPIAMSRFGETMLREASRQLPFDLEPLYVPHGVDTEVFRPKPEMGQIWRERMEIPEDAFLVGMVAANAGWNPQLSRKSFPQAFDAFGRFLKKHDDAYIYVHSRLHAGMTGQDLKSIARMMEIPEARFRSPGAHAWHLGVMGREYMAGVYSSFSVLLNPSMSEGFGVAVIEAQACGVPVITSNFSSMPELTHAGWLAQGDRFWSEPQKANVLIPHIASILDCLEQAYENRDNQELREEAQRFALTYDADRVMEKYWIPALEQLAKPHEIPPLNGKVSRHPREVMLTGRAERRAKEHPGKRTKKVKR